MGSSVPNVMFERGLINHNNNSIYLSFVFILVWIILTSIFS